MERLYDKLKAYSESDFYAFHMPGHKRNKALLGIELPYDLDITEIDGFDDLHHADGILKEEQERAARVFGAEESHFLVNGSTAGILSAVMGCTHRGDKILVARHCGDVLARKTWTPNYLDHKSRKNNQDRNQYRKVGHHEAIISRDDFIAVQKLITNAKYGNKEILPELHVIQEGSLSGFISINPRWSGFKARDYFEASQSVLKPANMNVPDTITASAGSFDLRDYEVARGQFFSSVGRISVSFSYKQISFNKDAIRKFPNIKFVELLIHPSSKLLAIRPCSSETKNKVQWSRLKDGQLIPKPISGAAFLPTLYEIFKWDKKCKYRILGVAHQKDNENVLIFNMDDTEIRIPTSTNDVSAPNNNTPDTISDSKSVLAYPADWMNSFGNNYYTQSQAPELTEFTADKNWQTASESKPYKEPELQTTPKETIIQNIKNIITEIKGDTQ